MAASRVLTKDELEQFFSNQVQKLFVDVQIHLPTYYFGHEWLKFLLYFAEPGLGIGNKMMRVKAFFEAFRIAMFITIKILNFYKDDKTQSKYLDDMQLKIEIQKFPEFFKIVINSEPESKDEAKCFNFFIDRILLLEKITAAKNAGTIANMIEEADAFYAMLASKISSISCLLSALRSKIMDDGDYVGRFSDAIDLFCINKEIFQKIRKSVTQTKDCLLKKQEAIQFFKNFISIGNTHLNFLARLRSTQPSMQETQALLQVAQRQDVLAPALKRLISFAAPADAWIDNATLYRKLLYYYSVASNAEEINRIAEEIHIDIDNAQGFINMIDDEAQRQEQQKKQVNTIRILIDAINDHLIAKGRQIANDLYVVGLEKKYQASLRTAQAVSTESSAAPGTIAQIKLDVKAAQQLAKVAAIYTMELSVSENLVNAVTKYFETLKNKCNIVSNPTIVNTKKYIKKLNVFMAQVIPQIECLKLPNAVYSPENAVTLSAMQASAQSVLVEMQQFDLQISAEIQYFNQVITTKKHAAQRHLKKLKEEEKVLEEIKLAAELNVAAANNTTTEEPITGKPTLTVDTDATSTPEEVKEDVEEKTNEAELETKEEAKEEVNTEVLKETVAVSEELKPAPSPAPEAKAEIKSEETATAAEPEPEASKTKPEAEITLTMAQPAPDLVEEQPVNEKECYSPRTQVPLQYYSFFGSSPWDSVIAYVQNRRVIIETLVQIEERRCPQLSFAPARETLRR